MNILLLGPTEINKYIDFFRICLEEVAERLTNQGHVIKCPALYGNSFRKSFSSGFLNPSPFNGDISDIDIIYVMDHKNYMEACEKTNELVENLRLKLPVLIFQLDLSIENHVTFVTRLRGPKLSYDKSIPSTALY